MLLWKRHLEPQLQPFSPHLLLPSPFNSSLTLSLSLSLTLLLTEAPASSPAEEQNSGIDSFTVDQHTHLSWQVYFFVFLILIFRHLKTKKACSYYLMCYDSSFKSSFLRWYAVNYWRNYILEQQSEYLVVMLCYCFLKIKEI